LPKKTDTVLEIKLVTARSGFPSPLKSAVVILLGRVPPEEKELTSVKPPDPLPKKTDTILELAFVTAISGFPSPLKSAVVIPVGRFPPEEKGLPGAGVKPPDPLPKKTDTVSEDWFVTARSGFPSPLKSAVVILKGPLPPVEKGLVGGWKKEGQVINRTSFLITELELTPQVICTCIWESAKE
jgi:hypothetical protein